METIISPDAEFNITTPRNTELVPRAAIMDVLNAVLLGGVTEAELKKLQMVGQVFGITIKCQR